MPEIFAPDRKYPARPRIYPVNTKTAKDTLRKLADGCWVAPDIVAEISALTRISGQGPDISGGQEFR